MTDKISYDDPLFKEVSDYYELKVEWLQALVQIESGGRLDAHRWEPHILDYSLGLTQVLTSTACWMSTNSKAFPIPQDQWKELICGVGEVQDAGTKHLNRAMVDPAVNLYLGGAYLAYQLRRYNQDLLRSIAAYNSGSARLTSSGLFVNQAYVDKFLSAVKQHEGVSE